MESLKKKLNPKSIYLTDGSLQKISWLCKEWETIFLWSPTTQEIVNTLEEYTNFPRAVIITPRSLKTSKEDKTYGFPLDRYLLINDLTYVFVSLDSSPQILDLDDNKDAGKNLKNKLETNLNGLRYKRLNLNSKSFDILKEPEVSSLLEGLDKKLLLEILETYKDYPYELVKALKHPEFFDKQEHSDLISPLVNELGTLKGVQVWSNLTNQEIMANFIIKSFVAEANANVPFIVKSICNVGKTTPYDSIYGKQKLPSPFNQDLFLYLRPILNKVSSLSVDRARLYLALFARFCLAVSVNNKNQWFCGFQKQVSMKGSTYLATRLSEEQRELWYRSIFRI